MGLTRLALKRPVSCMLIILALAVFGITSIFGFKLQLIPDMELPMLIVMNTYPGADAESVDKLVTSVIEDAGSALSGVDSTQTISYDNYGLVLFTYEYGVDITECHDDLRAALEVAKLSMPDDAGDPTIIEMNINSMGCMMLSAIETGDVDLLKVVNESVVPELESISGVAQVNVSGGSEEYIRVELNDTLMNQYGLTMSGISQFLTAVDFSYPAGSVKQGNQDVSVTTTMEYNTVQKLREVPLLSHLVCQIAESGFAVKGHIDLAGWVDKDGEYVVFGNLDLGDRARCLNLDWFFLDERCGKHKEGKQQDHDVAHRRHVDERVLFFNLKSSHCLIASGLWRCLGLYYIIYIL